MIRQLYAAPCKGRVKYATLHSAALSKNFGHVNHKSVILVHILGLSSSSPLQELESQAVDVDDGALNLWLIQKSSIPT